MGYSSFIALPRVSSPSHSGSPSPPLGSWLPLVFPPPPLPLCRRLEGESRATMDAEFFAPAIAVRSAAAPDPGPTTNGPIQAWRRGTVPTCFEALAWLGLGFGCCHSASTNRVLEGVLEGITPCPHLTYRARTGCPPPPHTHTHTHTPCWGAGGPSRTAMQGRPSKQEAGHPPTRVCCMRPYLGEVSPYVNVEDGALCQLQPPVLTPELPHKLHIS
jgi:hypothetical protein